MAYFQTKIPDLGKFLEGLAIEDVGILLLYFVYILYTGIFCGHLIYFMDIWHIFSPFGYVATRKIWQPCLKVETLNLHIRQKCRLKTV
jgi:hypothetical protein